MSEERQTMTVKEQLRLEGYKNLSAWNDRDVQTVASYDKIFLPVIITGWAISFVKSPSSFFFVYIGGLLLLTFWMFLSRGYRKGIAQRFCIMGKLECCLDFKAHRHIQENPLTPSTEITLRWCFYCVTVILGAVVAIMTPGKLEAIVNCSRWHRILILILVLLLITLIALLIKFLPSLYKKLLKTVGKG